MSRNVVPSADLADGLGRPGKSWKWIYVGEVHVGSDIVMKESDGNLALSLDGGEVFKALMPAFDYASVVDLGAPTVSDYTSVMSSGFPASAVTGTLTATFDVPRNLQVVYPIGWDGGAVTVTGTDAYGNSASETFTFSVSEPQIGNTAFANITGITKALIGVNTVELQIGVGNKFGTGYIHSYEYSTVLTNGTSPTIFAPVDLAHGTIEVEVDGISRYMAISKVQYTPNTL